MRVWQLSWGPLLSRTAIRRWCEVLAVCQHRLNPSFAMPLATPPELPWLLLIRDIHASRS